MVDRDEHSSGVMEPVEGTLVVRGPRSLAPFDPMAHELAVEQVVAQVQKIQRCMKELMHEGEHYGKIPGVDKPSLYKPGAEKLCFMFRLRPEYESIEFWDGPHLTVKSRCRLYHIPSGAYVGMGEGSCSTKESKYAYRKGKRACPHCGAEAINRSKFAPRDRPNDEPGWYCYAKAGGCGAQFAAGDPAILEQATGRIANEDLADQYNTVLKMANKRSNIASVLGATAASDIFTQDVEDLRESEDDERPPERGARRVQSNRDDDGLSEEQTAELNGLTNQINVGGQVRVTKGQVDDSLGTRGYGGTLAWLRQQIPTRTTPGPTASQGRAAVRSTAGPSASQQGPTQARPATPSRQEQDGLDFNI